MNRLNTCTVKYSSFTKLLEMPYSQPKKFSQIELDSPSSNQPNPFTHTSSTTSAGRGDPDGTHTMRPRESTGSGKRKASPHLGIGSRQGLEITKWKKKNCKCPTKLKKLFRAVPSFDRLLPKSFEANLETKNAHLADNTRH